MKNFSIMLIFCGFSIRINLCQENQVYTFYPSLTQLYSTVTQGQPNGFAQKPIQDEVTFQEPQITEYVFKSDPELTTSQKTIDPIRTQYLSESVNPNEQDMLRRVTYVSGQHGDTKRLEMNSKSESFIQDVNYEKHSSRPQNEIFTQRDNTKEDADLLLRTQTPTGIEGINIQAFSQQQQYPAYPSHIRGNSLAISNQDYNRPAPQQLYYVAKSSNLPTKWKQTLPQAYPQQVTHTKFIQNQNPPRIDDNQERYPLQKPKNNNQQSETFMAQQDYLHQQVDQNQKSAHIPSSPNYNEGYNERLGASQIQTFGTHPQNENVNSEFSALGSSNPKFNELPNKDPLPLPGSTVSSSDNQGYSLPSSEVDGKPNSNVVYQPQSKPGKLQGFIKLTAPHFEPIKAFHKNPFTADLYITKKPCEVCCKRDESEPCTSCCKATPLLSVRTLKTVIG